MRRVIARVVFVGLAAVFAAGAGALGALVASRPGRALLARLVSDQSNRLVRGTVTIGKIDGDFRTHLALDAVVVRDTAGLLLASIPRLELQFSLSSILAKRVVFTSVRAYQPEVQIIKHREGRMNFQEVLRLGEGQGGGGSSPLVQFRDLEVRNGRLTFLTPWNPDGRLRTDRQRDSALAAERAKPGRRIEQGPGTEGMQQVRVLEDLTVRFPLLTVSSPDGRPLNGSIDTLATRLSDPAVTVRDLKGTIEQGADSLVFALHRAALPATWGEAEGRIDWPQDTILYDFRFAAKALDLTDLRWISPEFPALAGSGTVAAKSVAGSRVEFDLRELRLADAESRVAGRLIAVLDVYRGLGFRNLDVDLANFSLEAIRPYLDTLPFAGRLSGPLRASGFFDAMVVDFDWRFNDAGVEAPNVSDVSLSGGVTFVGADGLEFRDATVRRADLDLRTVRLLAPAVQLNGRLGLAGSLNGPLRNAVFDGRVVHTDGDRPVSALRGRTRLDTRGPVLALDADLVLDSLWFEGLRGSFPTTSMRGGLSGPVRLTGDLERLEVVADVRGELGRLVARGTTTLQPPRWGADALEVRFTDLNLASVNANGPQTTLNGLMILTGRIDTLVAPEASIDLHLTAGRVREAPHDSARFKLSVHDSLLVVDTARVWWEGGEATAAGSLGWFDSHPGRLEGDLVALALGAYDSLAIALFGRTREQVAEGELLAGRARGRFVIEGSLDRWHLDATARADSVRWLDYESRGGTGRLQWWGGRLESPRFDVNALVDSVAIGRYLVRGVDGEARGSPDAFTWRLGAATTAAARLRAAGNFTRSEGERVIRVDSLAATVLGRTWALATPAVITAWDSLAAMDSIVIATDDGSGLIQMAGDFPGRESGRVVIQAFGVGLQELYALAQRDTTGISGRVALDARLEGTRRAPTLRGSGSVTGAVLGDFRAPLLRGVYNYRDQRLESNLSLWRTGTSVLDVDISLPLDLALTDVSRRQLPGAIAIRGQADSVDLAVVEAYTRNLRNVTGAARIDASVGGTWEAPSLGGEVKFSDGGAIVPGLGVRYYGLNGGVRLSGDSLVADGLSVRSGTEGTLDIRGNVRLANLTSPVLDLTLEPQDFLVMDVRDYLTLRARGEVTVTGPIARPVLTGSATATNSVLYFSDLITKDIVNLEDPMNADLVDTTALRAQDLRSRFQSRFLDSLLIRDLRVRVGQGVWLRSNEANLQLEGRVTVNKDRWTPRAREYRVSGQLQTPRGTYTLKLGPVFRTFLVERGTLQYFNTSDLDAGLDVEARHVVRTVQGGSDEYPIIARITGTLLAPKLSLTTASDRAPLPEADLVALLVTGTTRNSLFSQSNFGWEDALALGSTVLSAELQRSLISDAGLNLDLIEIRPGLAQGNSLLATGGSVTTLAVGRQLRPRLFAILSAGACLGNTVDFSYQYLGASLEYRFHPTLRMQLAAEPVQSCLTQAAQALGLRGVYQFAADLKWDREY